MVQEPQFLDLAFLAVIVLLLVFRLRSVLGTRPTSGENDKTESENKEFSKVVDISEYRTLENTLERENASDAFKNEAPETFEGLKKIQEAFPLFNLNDFMNKAPKAFEYIASSFASGNKKDLKPLLSRDLYAKFEKAIDERESKNETAEFLLVGFKKIQLLKAGLTGNFAELTVEFETEQTNLIKDANGNIVAGDPTYIETVVDVWTLRKDMKSADPVWILTATYAKA